MGELSPFRDAGPPPYHRQKSAPLTSRHPQGFAQASGEEEEYTIKCICGFQDDDGHTALCEQCNTWQHVDCYYYPSNKVPEVHQCADCYPRLLPGGAFERQRKRRETQTSGEERKARRSAPKTHRKPKSKDPALQNGLPPGGLLQTEESYDRTLRDLQPPLKRSKTKHTQSMSMSNSIGQRPRDPQDDTLPGKPIPLAECPPDFLSPDFIDAYKDDANFPLTWPGESASNEWSGLGMASEFSRWLDEPEEFDAVSNGRKQEEVLKRSADPIQDWDWPVERRSNQDPSLFHGEHPTWQFLVANKPIEDQKFIGELIGTIGHRDDYIKEPRNQWDRLRHPDHFVFFHPHLPIYIDCRSRGSLMRYVRRGCQPNVEMTTIVTGERDVHFCFTATRAIGEGEEIIVAWHLTEINDALHAISNRGRRGGDTHGPETDRVVSWVGTGLAHFGGCACNDRPEAVSPCLLSKFDRRITINADLDATAAESKAGLQRLGEERSMVGYFSADNLAADMEHRRCSPSLSGSRSRDVTPRAFGSPGLVNGTMPSNSERDRRKLQDAARRIDKGDYERNRRKKHPSGSSRQNTPVVGQSGKLAANFAAAIDVGTHPDPRNISLVMRSSTRSISPSQGMSVVAAFASRPEYVDNSSQTDPSDSIQSRPSPQPRPTCATPSQRRLQRLLLLRTKDAYAARLKEVPLVDRRPVPAPQEEASDIPQAEHKQSIANPLLLDSTQIPLPTEAPRFPSPAAPSAPAENPAEAQGKAKANVSANVDATIGPAPELERTPSRHTSSPPISLQQDVLMGEGDDATAGDEEVQKTKGSGLSSSRAGKLHVDLPPPLFQMMNPPNVSEMPQYTAPLPAADAAQTSPHAQQASDFAAPVAPMSAPLPGFAHSITQPSPIRKKLSLHDYSARRKARTPATEKNMELDQSVGSSPNADSHRSGEAEVQPQTS